MELLKKLYKNGDVLVKKSEEKLKDGAQLSDLLVIADVLPELMAVYEVLKQHEQLKQEMIDFSKEKAAEIEAELKA